tara:strand:+ start:3364 stop:3555 length:192 start_codon:yes stop_codon:yes gene_type:complete
MVVVGTADVVVGTGLVVVGTAGVVVEPTAPWPSVVDGGSASPVVPPHAATAIRTATETIQRTT